MWKRYLSFIMAMMLALHTAAVPVYAEEKADSEQGGTLDAELEEKPESEEETYTGQAIVLDKSQITVKLKGKIIEQDQYEIVPNSYKNNVKKGTASVTIRGVNNYGGTKTVKFNIRAKGFVWWK